MPYKSEDLAYIAGILDGEGYIGLIKYTEKRRTRETIYYNPSIEVAMCDKRAIDFINNLFEGNIWFHDESKYGNGNWKDQFEWSARGQKRVKEILKVVLPFLRIKKEQAEILVGFIENREKINTHTVKWGESSYTQDDYKIYEKLRELNKKGR